jgi:leukotriene-A4 hydrolase
MFLSDSHTIMTPDLLNTDPDEVFSSVPYEKGFQLLYYLETEVVKSEALMDDYLKDYVKTFARKTLTTSDFEAHFIAYFKIRLTKEEADNGSQIGVLRSAVANLATVDWQSWYRTEGMPKHTPTFHSSELVVSAKSLAESWANGASPSEDIKSWSCPQTLVFLDRLVNLQKTQLTKAQQADAGTGAQTNQLAQADAFAAILQKMDNVYHLSSSRNAEIRHRWLTACVRAEMESSFANCCDFLSSNGRGKFIRPLYT